MSLGRCCWPLALGAASLLVAGCRCGDSTPRSSSPPPPASPAPEPGPARAAPPPVDAQSPRRTRDAGAPPRPGAGAQGAAPRGARATPHPPPPVRAGPGAPPPAPTHRAAALPAPTLPQGIRRRGAFMDVDVYRRDVRRLLAEVASATATNLVLFEGVGGSVTVQLRGVPAPRALATVARALGFTVVESGSMVLVYPPR